MDFTNWSDRKLYEFLDAHENEKVCGRLNVTQLNRTISLPTQSPTKLYRLALALRLTILMSQTPQTNLFAKAPLVTEQSIAFFQDEKENNSTDSVVIKGQVVDEKGAPIIGAIVMSKDNSKVIGGCQTDIDGYFEILLTKEYVVLDLFLKVMSTGYLIEEIKLNSYQISHEIVLKLQPEILGGLIIQTIYEYKAPLIDKENPGPNQTFSSDQIKKLGH